MTYAPWTVARQSPSVRGISQARILECVAISFSRVSSQPKIEPRSPALAGGFFTTEQRGKPFGDHFSFSISTFLSCHLCLSWYFIFHMREHLVSTFCDSEILTQNIRTSASKANVKIHFSSSKLPLSKERTISFTKYKFQKKHSLSF